eukprot:1363838-Amorphochlora_amoeboformis.AAC.2
MKCHITRTWEWNGRLGSIPSVGLTRPDRGYSGSRLAGEEVQRNATDDSRAYNRTDRVSTFVKHPVHRIDGFKARIVNVTQTHGLTWEGEEVPRKFRGTEPEEGVVLR